MKTINVDGVEYVEKNAVALNTDHFVIVRCRDAGVHAGTLVRRDSGVVELKNSRRLWRWWSKFSLSGLAMEGPLESKIDEQRFACVLPELQLTESDVCEIITCTKEATRKIMEVPEWINK